MTAEEWFQKGVGHLEMSRGADSTREYRDDLEKACAAFAQCLALDTGHRAALRARGMTLAQLDEHTDALDCLVAYSAQVPNDEEVLFQAAESTRALEQPANAVPLYEAVRQLAPKRFDVSLGLSLALLDAGEAERAIPFFDHALTDHDPNGLGEYRLRQAMLGRAIALATLDDVRAQDAFQRAFRAFLKDLPRGPSELFEALRSWESARRALRQLQPEVMAQPSKLRLLAITWQEAGFPESYANLCLAARRSRELLVHQNPESADAWLAKAEDHLVDGQHELAFAAFEKAARLTPNTAASTAAARLGYERERFERSGPWKLMGRDTFAREDFVVATYSTRLAAEQALKVREERASASSADEALRDSYWLVKG